MVQLQCPSHAYIQRGCYSHKMEKYRLKAAYNALFRLAKAYVRNDHACHISSQRLNHHANCCHIAYHMPKTACHASLLGNNTSFHIHCYTLRPSLSCVHLSLKEYIQYFPNSMCESFNPNNYLFQFLVENMGPIQSTCVQMRVKPFYFFIFGGISSR